MICGSEVTRREAPFGVSNTNLPSPPCLLTASSGFSSRWHFWAQDASHRSCFIKFMLIPLFAGLAVGYGTMKGLLQSHHHHILLINKSFVSAVTPTPDETYATLAPDLRRRVDANRAARLAREQAGTREHEVCCSLFYVFEYLLPAWRHARGANCTDMYCTGLN
jgi:hypothetical protein